MVEDQEEVRKLVVTALKDFRYRTLAAGSAAEALVMLEQLTGRVDLVLTDVIMPGMDGKQLADRIRALYPNIKVLYMSGYPVDVIATRGPVDAKPSTSRNQLLRSGWLRKLVREYLVGARPVPKVLVVDDDPAIRDLLAEILREGGYEVAVAIDGAQAQRALEASHLELMITDLAMPNVEGLETIQAVRRNHPQLKVIALSGAFAGEMLGAAKCLGAGAALQKPVGPDQLLTAVRNVLG